MADGGTTGSKARAPRIAYSGEEFGFGYQASELFERAARRYGPCDGGWKRHVYDQEFDDISRAASRRYDFSRVQRLPLRAKEQALLAVKQGTADFAVVPYYSPYVGYDFETLRALSSLFGLMAVEQYEATDQLCLAVYEPQVLDLVQSAHPGSGLSALLKKERATWGGYNARPEERNPAVHESGEQYRAGLVIDQSAQLMLRDRIDTIFAGPEASRRCKSKLDGLRAAGVEVIETLRSVEPHREMARLARAALNQNRQTNTFYDPRDGKTHFVSTMTADPQAARLYGVILPFQVAMMSQEFTIIDPEIEDAEPAKTRFFVVGVAPDETLTDDAYKTTDAKTRYWMRRLRRVAHEAERRAAESDGTGGEPDPGVRVMLRFHRAGAAASIGDVEDFLRNFGVRHAVARIDEDSERENPAAMVLDIEFSLADFEGDVAYAGPFAAMRSWFARRFGGSVANGVLKRAFQRWKNRGVTVLAAVPYVTPQLPKHKRRTWYGDALRAWAWDFAETMFIRLSRVLLIYVLPLAALGLVGLAIWLQYFRG